MVHALLVLDAGGDGGMIHDFLALAAEIPLTTHVREYALMGANQALDDLRSGRLSGAAVLIP